MKIPNVLILHQYRWNTVRNRPFLSLMPNGMRKWAMPDRMPYRWILKYQISFPLFMVSELYKFQIFHWYRWHSPKRPWWSLETLWKLGIPCLGSDTYEFLPYTCFSVTHGIMLGRQGGKCMFQLMRLTKCKWCVWSIKVLEMRIHVRMTKTTKYWPRSFSVTEATGKIFLIV